MATVTPLAYSYVLSLIPQADRDGLALMATTRTQVEFEGYDPGVILALLEQRATASASDLNDDVLKIVVISIERGNNLDNMTKSMSEAGRNLVMLLKNRYQLVSKVGLDKKRSITLSRVAMSVPWISCPAMEFAVSPAVSWTEMKELSTGYPFHMIHPSYASTIPNSLPAYVREILIKAHLLAQVRLAEVINRKGGISSKPPSFYAARCYQFCIMSMSKQNIPETDRLKLQTQWKIIDSSNQPGVSVSAAAARYDQDKGDRGPLNVQSFSFPASQASLVVPGAGPSTRSASRAPSPGPSQ